MLQTFYLYFSQGWQDSSLAILAVLNSGNTWDEPAVLVKVFSNKDAIKLYDILVKGEQTMGDEHKLIVCFNEEEGKDTVLLVFKNDEGYDKRLLNTFYGEQAREMYKALVTYERPYGKFAGIDISMGGLQSAT